LPDELQQPLSHCNKTFPNGCEFSLQKTGHDSGMRQSVAK